MSVAFTCPFCSRKYRVDDSLGGRKVKCKECGTDLTVPSAAAASSPRDLYGMDDQDEAPPPPPRRPGAPRERTSSRAAKGGGFNLIVAVVAIVLVVPVLFAVLLPAVNAARQAAIRANANKAAANGPQGIIAPNGNPPEAQRSVVITGGRATNGNAIGMGVSFEIDYRVEARSAPMYDLILKSSKGRTKVMPPIHLDDSGTVRITIPGMNPNEAPFSAMFEPHRPGLGASSRPDSEFVSMNWTDAPQAPIEIHGPPPGFPRHGPPPGIPFGPRGPRIGPRGMR
jgi:predicted Zn finger-like uncharacterized protein